jgi:acyl carrier protein
MIVENLRLKVKPEDLVDDQPLFEAFGLDSIDALELVAAMEKEFGVSVTSGDVDRKVFENVGTIAAFIRENATKGV